MGKKTANPADAHRKALKKKEKDRNKEVRTKVREVKTLKSDTGGLEAEIRRIEESKKDGELDSNTRKRLADLRAEVDRIKKTKSEYVAAHPEHRKLVYGEGKPTTNDTSSDDVKGPFGKNGLPRHPERSIYYDPVLNPFGMPPPGMPYAERPLLPHEQVIADAEVAAANAKLDKGDDTESDSSEESEDDDIPMPSGPRPKVPPGDEGNNSDDADDDIPMPPGPPPLNFVPPLPPGPPPPGPPPMRMPPFPPQSQFPQTFPPPPPFGFPPPVNSNYSNYPPPPPPFPPPMGVSVTSHPYAYVPPPPPGFPPHGQLLNSQGNFPRRLQQHHDPLSDRPYRAYQDSRPLGPDQVQPGAQGASSSALPPIPAGMTHPLPAPPIPTTAVSSSSAKPPNSASATTTAAATIFAEPQLRDLKKESTAFVPSALKRKKGPVTAVNDLKKMKVDAAAAVGGGEEEVGVRPNLMTALRSSGLGDRMVDERGKGRQVDDYDAFLAEVGDIL
ncbi:hypothetical protein FRB95_008987 [Tulasnella sp. JGI-2019a]|nr:hypothetical protein FRB95_008987 [Tulasnella sp. JGI-2019a]